MTKGWEGKGGDKFLWSFYTGTGSWQLERMIRHQSAPLAASSALGLELPPTTATWEVLVESSESKLDGAAK